MEGWIESRVYEGGGGGPGSSIRIRYFGQCSPEGGGGKVAEGGEIYIYIEGVWVWVWV